MVVLLMLAGGSVIWMCVFVDWHRHTIVVNGDRREYLLFAPPYRHGELRRLVLGFHGFSGNAQQMADYSELRPLAVENGFFLAFVDGDPTWHSFSHRDADINPDIACVDRLLSKLVDTYPVDPHRIYAVGMSKGGDFVFHLAERRSTQIAAIVSQGACVADVIEAERPVPVMIIAGTKDGEVPFERLARIPKSLRERGHVVEVLRPENVGHTWHVPSNIPLWRFLSQHDLATAHSATDDQ